jgi:lipopolysaccharide biosynthesis protein
VLFDVDRYLSENPDVSNPISENDALLDNGFIEWSNIVSALPNFGGHMQPRLPADLGFYDLAVPETMDAQVALGDYLQK